MLNKRTWRRGGRSLGPRVAAGLFCLANPLSAAAQDGAPTDIAPLPEIKVSAKKQTPKPSAAKRGAARTTQAASAAPAPAPGAPTPAQAALDRKMQVMDQSRENLLPEAGRLVLHHYA